MYVVTFYSYKGGVGRSMALANVAALLAQAGRRVLLVDFDLEAPGLPSYGPLGAAAGLPGVVDYVEQYRRDLKSPDVANFIVECALDDSKPIWVMPAGDNRSPSYTERLSGIDWNELYAREEGFLMFEDLRQQWERHPAKFDYVLVDSRTGHTDVGGICTRQLPDAVVVMFVPTKQNIEGLAPVVSSIREAKRPNGRPITLHFCASNVPDEYDEDGVLATRMKFASEKLGYKDAKGIAPPLVTIHHRAGHEILEQGLVVIDRANSKLTKEYGSLRTSIIGENLSDVEGAKVTLERLPKLYEGARARHNGHLVRDISALAQEAVRLHSRDGSIALAAARIFSILGDFENELVALGVAIDADHRTNFARLMRASALLKAGRDSESMQDLHAILASPDGTIFEFLPASRLLATGSTDPMQDAAELLVRPETKPRAKLVLAQELLMSHRERMALVADEMMRILDDTEMSEELSSDVLNVAQLAFISDGKFEDAAHLRPAPKNVPELFNNAIALWGATGKVPLDEFDRILSLPRSGDENANVRQCYGLIKAALGDVKSATSELDIAIDVVVPTSKIFDCWTYLFGTGEQLLKSLREMRKQLRAGRPLKPPFLEKLKGS